MDFKEYPDFPEFTTDKDGNEIIIVNPWKLCSHVLEKLKGNRENLEYAPVPLLPLRYIIENTNS